MPSTVTTRRFLISRPLACEEEIPCGCEWHVHLSCPRLQISTPVSVMVYLPEKLPSRGSDIQNISFTQIHTYAHKRTITQLVTEMVRWLVVTPADPLPSLCCNHITYTARLLLQKRNSSYHIKRLLFLLLLSNSQIMKIMNIIIKLCLHQTFSSVQMSLGGFTVDSHRTCCRADCG